MGKEVLKWVAALGTGAATAALAFISSHIGAGPAVDPLVAGVVVLAVTKIVGWLTSKVPTSA